MKHNSKDHDFGRFYHVIIDHGVWSKLSGAACKVYGVLLRHANYSALICFPSRATIVKESGVGKNKITTCLNELKGLGLILVKRSGRRFGFRNVYTIISHPLKPVFQSSPQSKRICPVYKDKSTGKFCKSLKAVESDSPHIQDPNTCPSLEDKKEREREKIEISQEQEILDSITDPALKKVCLSLRQTLGHREVGIDGKTSNP